jgi:hypothetical protein
METAMTTHDTQPRDPLLIIAKAVIWFILGVLAFAGIIVAICVPGILIVGPEFVEAAELEGLSMGTRGLIAVLLACIAGLLYLAWRFFRAMLAIVHSVSEGDPFIPANADRLTAMAWMMLAINVAVLPLALLGGHIAQITGDAIIKGELNFDTSGLILVLTPFILARVFRHGAAMREDLEGTV